MRTGLITLVLIVGISFLLVAPAAAATIPGAMLTLAVSSGTVAPGDTVTLSGTITNTSTAGEKVAVTYVATGPCGYSTERTILLALWAGQSRSASIDVVAPLCAGGYTIAATVRAGTTVLAAASATVEVVSPTVVTVP